jgi:D-glycero-D-manno-heptose 1,7-bisphosphate phosphatase
MRAVLLDRDGVINENRPDHVKLWNEFTFLPGALAALRLLWRAGWTTVVVSNQAVIGRGVVPSSAIEMIERRMTQAVDEYGGRIAAVFHCPHRPDDGCGCRKPRPGLLLRAAERFGLELDQSYLIGDALTDIAAGHAVGCACILVQTGLGQQQSPEGNGDTAVNYHVAADLLAAVRWMLAREHALQPSETPLALAGSVSPWLRTD